MHKRGRKRYKTNRWLVFIFAGLYLCTGVISLLLYPSCSLDVHLNYYYNYVICFLMILSGNMFLFYVSSRVNVRLHFLEFIGKHSLILYMVRICNFYIYKNIDDYRNYCKCKLSIDWLNKNSWYMCYFKCCSCYA